MAAILAGMISAVLASGQGDSVPASSMAVKYHPDAKRPYEPTEPMWSGGPPCSQFPSTGSGTLRLTRAMTPPKLLRKTKADYSRLGPKTRLFAPFLAEYTVSTEGGLRKCGFSAPSRRSSTPWFLASSGHPCTSRPRLKVNLSPRARLSWQGLTHEHEASEQRDEADEGRFGEGVRGGNPQSPQGRWFRGPGWRGAPLAAYRECSTGSRGRGT